jgi:hypothetical protein
VNEDVFYKVSFVVTDGRHPGAIITLHDRPEVGDEVAFNGSIYAVTEVVELLPPVENLGFLHATCELARSKATA